MRIVICGAGIAGPTLAYWLRRAGHDPLLIEQSAQPRDGGYIVDFWGLGYDVAERMGLLPAVLRRGYKVQEVRLVGAGGGKVGGFPATVFRRLTGDRFISLPRDDLARLLYENLAPQVEIRFADSVAEVRDQGAKLRIALDSGAELDADLLVGADGLHSRVRTLAFGPQRHFEHDLGYRVAAFRLEGYQPRDELVYLSHGRPGRQVARFALRDGRTLFFFIFAAERTAGAMPRTAAARKALLAESFAGIGWECPEILRQMQALPDIYLDRVSQIHMPRWSSGRILLLGDAAAAVSLLAGEGCGLAMVQAYVLAHELARSGGDHRQAFLAWEQRLRPFVEAKQRAAERFASSFVPRTALGLWLRNQATRLLRLPLVAGLLLGRSVRDDFVLPDWHP
jgi:2-polyprenyl-6-methoxyphenol hydroxylase-like FAD-dependent oxidoreductase